MPWCSVPTNAQRHAVSVTRCWRSHGSWNVHLHAGIFVAFVRGFHQVVAVVVGPLLRGTMDSPLTVYSRLHLFGRSVTSRMSVQSVGGLATLALCHYGIFTRPIAECYYTSRRSPRNSYMHTTASRWAIRRQSCSHCSRPWSSRSDSESSRQRQSPGRGAVNWSAAGDYTR
jgi:hypothetical protein